MTIPEQEAIDHIASTPEGALLVSFLESVVLKYADVRSIKDKTPEGYRGAELACDIIEQEIIQRISKKTDGEKFIVKEEYE